MIKPEDIKNVTFEQSVFSGYKKEEVDSFLDKIQQEVARLYKENAELVEKLKTCVTKIEEYRQDEQFLKSAIVNAQKLNETTIRDLEIKRKKVESDAEKRAASILEEAQEKAEALTKETEEKVAQFREKTTAEFSEKRKNEEYAFLKQKEEYAALIAEEQATLDGLKSEVSDFRNSILGMYKQQVTLICALPEKQPMDEPAQEDVPEEEPVKTKEIPQEEPVLAEEPVEEPASEIVEIEPEAEEQPEEIEPETQEEPEIVLEDPVPVALPVVDDEPVLTFEETTSDDELAEVAEEFYAEEPKVARSPVEPAASPLHLPSDVERDIEEPVYYEEENDNKKRYRNLKFGIDFDVNSDK